MKTMRYFPLIALVVLGFIVYGLYRTSRYVNKKANAKALSVQDSIINNTNGSVALPTEGLIADTLSPATVQTITAPSPSTHSQSGKTKKDPASAESKTHPDNPASTSLAAPKTKATKSPKAGEGSTATAEETKTDVKKQAKTNGIADKTTSNKTSTAVVTKGDIPKSASIAVKKEASEPTFHVIVGSYGQEANATAKAAAFEQKNNKKATIIKQGGFYRVCAATFEYAQAASQYAQKLKEAGEENIIVKF